MYTLKQGNKTMSVYTCQKHYVIGFQKVLLARHVQYMLHPEPKLTLIKDPKEYARNRKMSLAMDGKATLFVPKCRGSTLHPMNDGNFHLHQYKTEEFMMFPYEKQLGIVIPYFLQEESEDEFMFKSLVIEPEN